MAVKTFEVPKVGTISVYKRRGSKNIRLSVTADGSVRVSLPSWLPYKAGLAFAMQKQRWIAQHNTQQNLLTNGDMIGRRHHLTIEDDTGSAIKTRVTDDAVIIKKPANIASESEVVQHAAVKAAKRALLQEAEAYLPGRLRQLASQHGFIVKSVTIRHLKTRWGSCNSKQEITLNYYLMQLPDVLIDYVLYHELAHTMEMNHGSDFWAIVSTYIPEYKQHKSLLRTYQPSVISGQNST